jgi:hypothetical protein
MSIPPPQSVRVLIVDDHGIMCAGLRMLLESQSGIMVGRFTRTSTVWPSHLPKTLSLGYTHAPVRPEGSL